ncbi:MAG: malate dehydrogenase [Archaeoglobi archaeon]|jgi:malate dehydrogenase|nr:MAG: malate dehydrogenase [Archaeoglobi archaeon]TDA28984.1 MAG: malate dehydrogenase [Archaeoglobi archaeon]
MKLGFVGAGRVGSVTAFTCLMNLEVDEIALVDIAEDLAVGEAIDLSHAASAIGKYPKIYGGSNYSLLKGSEIVVVSAGFARKPGMTRLDLATKNAGIIRDVSKKIVEVSPESKILMVTNPMDLMTYVAWKESGKSRNEVFGMGNVLDSSRLARVLHDMNAKFERAWIIGEHGDSMFIARSISKIERADLEAAEKATREVAAEVIKRKGATIFGPAVSIFRMIKAVVENTKEIMPCSVVLQGEYGIKDVAIGVPVRLGKNGVEILEFNLSKEDLEKLRKSAEILKERLKEIGY